MTIRRQYSILSFLFYIRTIGLRSYKIGHFVQEYCLQPMMMMMMIIVSVSHPFITGGIQISFICFFRFICNEICHKTQKKGKKAKQDSLEPSQLL